MAIDAATFERRIASISGEASEALSEARAARIDAAELRHRLDRVAWSQIWSALALLLSTLTFLLTMLVLAWVIFR